MLQLRCGLAALAAFHIFAQPQQQERQQQQQQQSNNNYKPEEKLLCCLHVAGPFASLLPAPACPCLATPLSSAIDSFTDNNRLLF